MTKLSCPNCQNIQETYFGKYCYTESGLENVWLDDVEIFECTCGEKFALISEIPKLHVRIGKDLLMKQGQLSGREIRFLRKNLGLKSKDFAELLMVTNITLSRWEHGEITPTRSMDRLIRLTYANRMRLAKVARDILKVSGRESVVNTAQTAK